MRVVRRVYDEAGVMTALKMVDGTLLQNPYTGVGAPCVSWNEVTGKKEVVGVIVWDGASHAQLTGWWDSVNPLGPRAKITGLYQKGYRGQHGMDGGWEQQKETIENLVVAQEKNAA